MKTNYYLLTEEGVMKVNKSPYKMMKHIGIGGLPHVYKSHYFHLVYGRELLQLKTNGLTEFMKLDVPSQRELDGGEKLKDIMEKALVNALGEDSVDIFKDELEQGWKEMMGEIDNNVSDEAKDMADKLIEDNGFTVEEDNIPTLMFP